ncbi:OsmC family protein [Chryseolinea lacunae]|uniref:OsmC family protein n=1 Tax=Chryseolinea lacunae TaxID=2801331 RepID=UPI0034E2B3E0
MTWNKDRRGVMCSPEIHNSTAERTCIEVATPPEFPNGIPGIWSPEHLFTAAVSSCFMTTFLSIAENSKLDFKTFRCDARGTLEQLNNKYRMTEILLEPHLVIVQEKDRDRALRVLQKTESACLITNSITTKVTMRPHVEVPAKLELT